MKNKKIIIALCTLCSFLISGCTNLKVSENSKSLTLKDEKKMNYDEILSEMIKDGIKKEKAIELLGEKPKFSMLRSENQWYTTIEDTVTITPSYKVRPKFYILAEGGHGVYFIKKVITASLNNSYEKNKKIFSGNLFYNLESKTNLYYRLDGDFYNDGFTSASDIETLEVGENITFNVSHSKNHYKYIYKESHINFGKLR